MKFEGFRVPSKIGFVIRGFSMVCANTGYELYIRASNFISFNKYTNTQVIILLQLSH